MLKVEELMRIRQYSSNNYGCPVHIGLDSCKALFDEAGVTASADAVGALGDVIENFALTVIRDIPTKNATKMDIKIAVQRTIADS